MKVRRRALDTTRTHKIKFVATMSTAKQIKMMYSHVTFMVDAVARFFRSRMQLSGCVASGAAAVGSTVSHPDAYIISFSWHLNGLSGKKNKYVKTVESVR